MPSQAHAGAAQEAPDIGQWEGQDVPLVIPSSCNVKGGIPSSRRYLPTSHMEKFLKKHLGRGGTPTPERGKEKGPKNSTNTNQGCRKGRGNLRALNEVKPDAGTPPLFYCKPINDKGGPCHAPDCDHRSSCMLQMKR